MQRWIPAFTGITGEGGNDRVVRLREQVRDGDGVESRIPGHIATEGLGDDAERNHRATVLDVRSSLESNDLAIDDHGFVADLKANGGGAKDDRDAPGRRDPCNRGTKGLGNEANRNKGAAGDDFRRSVDGGSLAINSHNVGTNSQDDDPLDSNRSRCNSDNAGGVDGDCNCRSEAGSVCRNIAGFSCPVRQKTLCRCSVGNNSNRERIYPGCLRRIIQSSVRCTHSNSAKLPLAGYGQSSRNEIDGKLGDCLHRNGNDRKLTTVRTCLLYPSDAAAD